VCVIFADFVRKCRRGRRSGRSHLRDQRLLKREKFNYEKELSELTRNDVRKVEKEIIELKSSDTNINIYKCVNYTTLMTMVDGKVINTLTGSSSQICFVCNCNPNSTNNLDQMHNFQINENNLKYEF